MKLLYFTIQINMVGGLARIVIDKINWLVAHGYDVTLCNIEALDVKPAYPIDPRVKLFRGDIQTNPGGILTRAKGVIGAVRRTKEAIRKVRPDISRQGLEVFNRQFMSPIARWGHRHAIKWIYSRYEQFVVLTNGDKEAWGCKNCMVIPNFHNFQVLDNLPEQKEHKEIILLARLMPQKRIDLMIDIWAELAKDFPDWRVKVLGEGMLRPQLEAKVKKLGLEKSFLMPGEVKVVTTELQASDILCLTSEYEGFGIVLIEAMAKGIPVIAFEYVGVHDIIINGVDGLIVPFGDVQGYAQKLRQLMTNKDYRDRLATTALLSVHKFDKERTMVKWLELFGKLNHNG